jgi:DNA-binding transcriptional ArsR family regulator
MQAATRRAPKEDRELSRFLTALGEPARQQILFALSQEELNVGDLAERFPISRPAMSHHLKVLADAGLLVQERRGRERIYRLDARRCRELVERFRQFALCCCSGKACC